MRSCALILAICVLAPCAVLAQQSWERYYGGDDDDYGRSVQQTSDGGYIVTGYTRSFGDSDQVYLVKTDAHGDTLWTRTYGGARNDDGYSVQQTKNGGYVITGPAYSYGLGGDAALIRTNASGDTVWTRSFGGTKLDGGNSVRQTLDGGYIMAGVTNSFGNGQQVYLVRTNASGDTLWTRVFGGAYLDAGSSVEQTKDSGYIVAGTSSSFGTSFEVYFIKTDAAGDTAWTRTYGGAQTEFGSAVQQTQDGGYILTGYSESFGDSAQVYLVKATSTGDTVWTRTYGGTRNDCGSSVRQTQDGGYVVAGYTNSFGAGDRNVYLIKTNASGDTVWTRTFGGGGVDVGLSVQQTSDLGYIVAGYSLSLRGDFQVCLIKTDENGNVGIAESFRPQTPSFTHQAGIVRGVLVLGAVAGRQHTGYRAELLDISGRKVLNLKVGANDVSHLAAGVYFVHEASGVERRTSAVTKVIISR
jgi:hypothetical protein